MPVGAQSPHDRDRLLEAERGLDARSEPNLAVARVPPAMPRPARNRNRLARAERLLLAVDEVRDSALQDLDLLVEVVVNVLAARHESALFDGELADDSL